MGEAIANKGRAFFVLVPKFGALAGTITSRVHVLVLVLQKALSNWKLEGPELSRRANVLPHSR